MIPETRGVNGKPQGTRDGGRTGRVVETETNTPLARRLAFSLRLEHNKLPKPHPVFPMFAFVFQWYIFPGRGTSPSLSLPSSEEGKNKSRGVTPAP